MKQFQYTGWPEEGVPDMGSGLIDVIGQVQKWQRSSGDRPIVVHCRLVGFSACSKRGYLCESFTIVVIAVVDVVDLALILLSVSYLNV